MKPKSLAFILMIGGALWADSLHAGTWPDAFRGLDQHFQALCEKSPEILSGRHALDLARQSERIAARFYQPDVTLTSAVGLLPGTSANDSGPAGSGSYGAVALGFDLNLTPLFSPLIEMDRSSLAARESEMALRIQIQNKVEELLNAVLSRSLTLAREKDLQETRSRLERQYRVAGDMVRRGIAQPRDQQRFEAEILRLRENTLSLERSRLEQEEKLATLLGDPELAKASVVWPDLNRLRIDSPSEKDESPELQLARLRQQLTEAQEHLVRQQTGLVTSLSGRYLNQNSSLAPGWSQESLRGPFRSDWSLMLNFNYPLWDRGQDYLERSRARTNHLVSESELERAERDFQASLRLFRDQKARVEERRQLATQLHDLEKKNFAQVEIDYRQGRIGYLDWLNANQSLQSSVTSLIDSATEWARLWVRSEQLKGRLGYDLCVSKN